MSHRVLDFIGVQLRQEHQSSGEVHAQGPRLRPAGRHIVIVEDIVDTGLTLTISRTSLKARSPKTLRTACRCQQAFPGARSTLPSNIGFTIEDRSWSATVLTVLGNRNLPYIAVLNE
jgi:hypoxanthine-guanine phosphoribosyltransferase